MTSVETSPTRPKIACAECALINDCNCLDQLRLLDELAPLVRQLVEHITTDGHFMGDEVPDRVALLLDRNDQRQREWNAWPEICDAEGAKSDREIIEALVSSWGFTPSFLRTVEGVAERRNVPVEHVRALLDRFLRESRPEPAAAAAPAVQQSLPAPSAARRNAEEARHALLLEAARRLLVDGTDPTRTNRQRERIRHRARQRMRAILGVTAPKEPALQARDGWPTWAVEVVNAVERRAA